MRVLLLLLAILHSMAQATPSIRETRLALVIGNSHYQSLSQLQNPANDAQDMASTLRHIGFETTLLQDASRTALLAELASFQRRIRPDTVALVFYAGHGLQVAGQNYLMPIDARADNELAVKTQGIPLDEIFNLMEVAGARLKIVYLDACRNAPPQLLATTRSAAVGLAPVKKASGTLIEFATEPGNVAQDGGPHARNSPYTAALLRHLPRPGLQIEQISKLVRAEVLSVTGGLQRPWSESAIIEDFIPLPSTGQGGEIVIRTETRQLEPGESRGTPLLKPESECVRQAGMQGVHPTDLIDYVNACKSGQAYQLVARKSANDCIREAQRQGLKGLDLADYTRKCYASGSAQ